MWCAPTTGSRDEWGPGLIESTQKLALAVTCGIAVGALSAAGLLAIAEPPTERAHVIPYDGVVELDGVAVSGAMTLRFTLFDSFAADAEAVWTDVLDAEVVNGRFRTLLGRQTPFPVDSDALFRRDGIFLSVEVAHPDLDDVWIALNNRQRIAPSPAAHVTRFAHELELTGDLTVEGSTEVVGDLTIGSADDAAATRIVGTTRANSLITNTLHIDEDDSGAAEWQITMDGEDLIVAEPDDEGQVHIRVRPSGQVILSPGGDTRLTLGSTGVASVIGDLQVNGRLVVDGKLDVASATVNGSAAVSGIDVDAGTSQVTGLLTVEDSVTTVGRTDLRGGVDLEDDLRMANNLNPIFLQRFEWDNGTGGGDGNDTTWDTGISTETYACFVGSVSFPSGDYNEDGKGLIARAFTYEGADDDWWIRADVRSDSGGNEGRKIGVVCFNRQMVSLTSWFNSDSDGG